MKEVRIKEGSIEQTEVSKKFEEFTTSKERYVDVNNVENSLVIFSSLGIEMFHQIVMEDDINSSDFEVPKEISELGNSVGRDWNEIVADNLFKNLMEFCNKHPEFNFKRIENQMALCNGNAYAAREMKRSLLDELL